MFQKFLLVLVLAPLLMASNCDGTPSAERADAAAVNDQQSHYRMVQPVPFFEYSLQRNVYTQIYMATNEARATYTVVESITGELKFHCPSVGYGIPADVSLTNPVQGVHPLRSGNGGATTIEQAEPNGLFSSKNTDGTWVLCVMTSGDVAPIYTEHKVTTFPFTVVRDGTGWEPADGSIPSTTVTIPATVGAAQ